MEVAGMKKTNEIAKLLVSQLITRRISDDSAQTITELATEWQYSRSKSEREVHKLMATGRIEKVWKKTGSRWAAAYRIKKA